MGSGLTSLTELESDESRECDGGRTHVFSTLADCPLRGICLTVRVMDALMMWRKRQTQQKTASSRQKSWGKVIAVCALAVLEGLLPLNRAGTTMRRRGEVRLAL